jgi:hypothetical protein
MKALVFIFVAVVMVASCKNVERTYLGPEVTPVATAGPTATFTMTPVPCVSGTWPGVFTNFDCGITTTNEGGGFASGGDYDEGGSPSTTAPVITEESAAPSAAGGNYVRYSYNTGLNSVLGYQYSYFSASAATQDTLDLSSFTGIRFYIRGAVGGENIKLVIETKAADLCLPGKNSMSYLVPVTAAWVQQTLPFSGFTDRYGVCPFIASGDLLLVNTVTFAVEAIETSSVDIDHIEFY